MVWTFTKKDEEIKAGPAFPKTAETDDLNIDCGGLIDVSNFKLFVMAHFHWLARFGDAPNTNCHKRLINLVEFVASCLPDDSLTCCFLGKDTPENLEKCHVVCGNEQVTKATATAPFLKAS